MQPQRQPQEKSPFEKFQQQCIGLFPGTGGFAYIPGKSPGRPTVTFRAKVLIRAHMCDLFMSYPVAGEDRVNIYTEPPTQVLENEGPAEQALAQFAGMVL